MSSNIIPLDDVVKVTGNGIAIGRNAVVLGKFSKSAATAIGYHCDVDAPEEIRGLALETLEHPSEAPAPVEPPAPARPDPFAELDAQLRPDPHKRMDPFAELEAQMAARMDPIGEAARQMDPFAEVEAQLVAWGFHADEP